MKVSNFNKIEFDKGLEILKKQREMLKDEYSLTDEQIRITKAIFFENYYRIDTVNQANVFYKGFKRNIMRNVLRLEWDDEIYCALNAYCLLDFLIENIGRATKAMSDGYIYYYTPYYFETTLENCELGAIFEKEQIVFLKCDEEDDEPIYTVINPSLICCYSIEVDENDLQKLEYC
jgi:hypothetical protein